MPPSFWAGAAAGAGAAGAGIFKLLTSESPLENEDINH